MTLTPISLPQMQQRYGPWKKLIPYKFHVISKEEKDNWGVPSCVGLAERSHNFVVSREPTLGRALKFASATRKNSSYTKWVGYRALFPSTHSASLSSFVEQHIYFVISASPASEVSNLSLCASLSISVHHWSSQRMFPNKWHVIDNR